MSDSVSIELSMAKTWIRLCCENRGIAIVTIEHMILDCVASRKMGQSEESDLLQFMHSQVAMLRCK